MKTAAEVGTMWAEETKQCAQPRIKIFDPSANQQVFFFVLTGHAKPFQLVSHSLSPVHNF